MTDFAPTDEQTDVMGMFASGIDLAVEAGAGTGKTSTLELIARNTRQSGTYMAFNRAIVNEAKVRMPMTVLSTTAHGMAMREYGHQYAHRLGGARLQSFKLAKIMGIGPVVVQYGSKSKVLQPGYLASHVMRAIGNFCASADPEPGPQHFPYIHGIDPPDADGLRSWKNNDHLRAHLADHLANAWADLNRKDGELRYDHDHYLKQWSLRDPVVPGSYLLFDEAQDATPVMLSIAERQVERGMQVVFVGDSQQQIYAWRGAVNALQQVPADATCYLTQSWRFGPAIANLANLVLDRLGADLRLTGNPGIESTVGASGPVPDAVLTRGNSAALEYVLHHQKAGRHPHLVGGGEELLRFAKGVHDLQEKGTSFHPDLACFGSWEEVKEYADLDPQGDELALMVRLIDEYGLQIVVDALDGMAAEENADVIISTAHRAKGREWAVVELAADFPDPGNRDDAAEEWRLLYVACTRARMHLTAGASEGIRGLVMAAAGAKP